MVPQSWKNKSQQLTDELIKSYTKTTYAAMTDLLSAKKMKLKKIISI